MTRWPVGVVVVLSAAMGACSLEVGDRRPGIKSAAAVLRAKAESSTNEASATSETPPAPTPDPAFHWDEEQRKAACAVAKDASTDELIAMLSGDPHQQYAAVSQFWDRGPAAAEAAPALAVLLDSPHENIRFMTAQSLGNLGRPGVEELVEALDGATEDELSTIGVGLRGVHHSATDAVPLLMEAVKHDNRRIRDAAISGLAGLIDIHGVPPSGLRDSGPGLVPQLVAMLGADIHHQLSAVEVLKSLGPGAIDALPALRDLLDSDNSYLGGTSAQALAGMGEPGIKALVRALDGASRERLYAIECGLRAVPPTADGALPWLMRATKHNDRDVRRAAFTAISRLKPAAHEALPRLFATVSDPDLSEHIQSDVARIDDSFGDAYRYTADILHRQADYGAFAAWHLQGVSREALDMALPYLKGAHIDDPGTKASLRYLYAKLDGDPEAQIDALMQCVEVCPAWQRVAAMRALGEQGSRAERAVPLLTKMANATLEDFPEQISQWNPDARDPWLLAFHKAAREALESIEPDRARIPALLKDLRSGSATDRRRAAQRLGRAATPEDADVIRALTAATDDPDPDVRTAAERALSKINSRTPE